MFKRTMVGIAMCSSVTVAIADDAIDARIAKVTPGYTLYVTKTLQMQSVKPFAFDTARGDCFVFVLRADAGGAFAESAIGQVAVDLKERSRGFSLDPDVAADGGVTRSYCPLVDGKVTFGAYQFVVDKKHPSGFHNVKLGKGGLRVEIWRKRAATAEVAKEEDARKAQAERDRKWDQIDADRQTFACPDCRKDRTSCLRGAYPKSVWTGEGLTCEQGFERCLKNRGSSLKQCPR